jgi:hypothetical protein
MKPAVRLSLSKLKVLAAELSERDHEIVGTVAKLRLVTMRHLQRLHFAGGTPASNTRLTNRVLTRLTNLEVLQRLERRIGGVRKGSSSFLYALGPAGQYLLGIEAPDRRRRPTEPGFLFIRHTLDIAELFVRLTEAYRAKRVELIEFEAEPDCWRPFYGPHGARVLLKPDAFVRSAHIGSDVEELRFVEVDRDTHSVTALENKFRMYRQHWASGREQLRWSDTYPRVLWLAPNLKRLRQLIDVAAAQPEQSWKLFQIRLYDEALAVFAPEESS